MIGTNERRQAGIALLLVVNAGIQNAFIRNKKEIRRIWEKLSY
jgi:hypothetical protein